MRCRWRGFGGSAREQGAGSVGCRVGRKCLRRGRHGYVLVHSAYTRGRSRWLVPSPALRPHVKGRRDITNIFRGRYIRKSAAKGGEGKVCLCAKQVYAKKQVSVHPIQRMLKRSTKRQSRTYVRWPEPLTGRINKSTNRYNRCARRRLTYRAPRLPRASPAPAAARPSFSSTRACP